MTDWTKELEAATDGSQCAGLAGVERGEMKTQTHTTTLSVFECAWCGMLFGITEQFEQKRRKDHGDVYCPAGHSLCYSDQSEEERLKKELICAQEEANRKGSDLQAAQAERDFANRSRSSIKGHLTRTKNRIGNGVCPCCNRTFKDLARHMQGQHPDYASKDHPND